jgi:hypothetical protein
LSLQKQSLNSNTVPSVTIAITETEKNSNAYEEYKGCSTNVKIKTII